MGDLSLIHGLQLWQLRLKDPILQQFLHPQVWHLGSAWLSSFPSQHGGLRLRELLAWSVAPPKAAFQRQASQETQLEAAKPRLSLPVHSVKSSSDGTFPWDVTNMNRQGRINDTLMETSQNIHPPVPQFMVIPYSKYIHHVPRPPKVLLHYGISSKTRTSFLKSGPVTDEVPECPSQVQLLEYESF